VTVDLAISLLFRPH